MDQRCGYTITPRLKRIEFLSSGGDRPLQYVSTATPLNNIQSTLYKARKCTLDVKEKVEISNRGEVDAL
jgi:hypothetical protein